MQGKKVAVTGKGGSGKTMLTAIMTRLLAREKHYRVLAIDADSAVSLQYALGLSVEKTVAEIRQQIIEDPKARAEMQNAHFRTVMEQILVSGKGFQLLTMGRPEGPGCYCAINDLLRYGINSLSECYDITLIDCEAGPEQVSRRVVKSVDLLIIVTDPSVRGMRGAGAILEVVRRDRYMEVPQAALVINRFKKDSALVRQMAEEWGLDIVGCIPEDEMLADYDSSGKPIIDLPETSPSVTAVKRLLERLALCQVA